MSSAFLIVAVFRNKDGILSAPEIWLGAVGETTSDICNRWVENLDNFNEGQEPVISHILEVKPEGRTEIISWSNVEALVRILKP